MKLKFVTGINKMKLGEIYQVEWVDHYSSEYSTVEAAVKHDPLILKTTGKYVGRNTYYIIVCPEYEDSYSENNEYTHILKKCIVKARKLK